MIIITNQPTNQPSKPAPFLRFPLIKIAPGKTPSVFDFLYTKKERENPIPDPISNPITTDIHETDTQTAKTDYILANSKSI